MSVSITRPGDLSWRTIPNLSLALSRHFHFYSTAGVLPQGGAGSTVEPSMWIGNYAGGGAVIAKSRSWVADLPRVTAGLRDLKDGWFGEGSKAPSASALNQVLAVATSLHNTKEPQIEVDPSDGEVSFIWADAKQASSISVTFAGGGRVIIVETDSERPLDQPVTRMTVKSFDDGPALAERLTQSPMTALVHLAR